jgi:uncharacterized protein (DUF779 family)
MKYIPPGEQGSIVEVTDRYENFIGGKWIAPVDGQYRTDPSPATAGTITKVPQSTAEDIELETQLGAQVSAAQLERTRVIATQAAHQAIARLHAVLGRRVMFVQSAGCGAGSTPMCFPDGEFLTGENDVLMGIIDGCPIYIDARLDEAWGRSELMLDVGDGEPEGFSLAAGTGKHFITTSTSCTRPSPEPEPQ